MKKYNVIEELQNIDDETIDNVLKIQNGNDLRQAKKSERHKSNFVWKKIMIAGFCFILVGAFALNNFKHDERIEIPSPLTEVESVKEMQEYLGFDVPILSDKEVEAYIVINNDDDKYADHGRIIYVDGSSFEIEKGKDDVSGIYGGKKEKELTIDDIKITVLTMEDIRYAIWTNGDHSYSYASDIDDDNFETDLNELIDLIK